MAEHDALGAARGARGVDDRREVVRRRRAAVEQLAVSSVALQSDAGQRQGSAAPAGRIARASADDDDRLNAGGRHPAACRARSRDATRKRHSGRPTCSAISGALSS